MNALFFVTGATNAGKSTFLKAAAAAFPQRVHLVEVGKALRAKYSPDYFKGQSNPDHTAQEALQLCFDGINEGRRLNRQFILVDGQPRDVKQLRRLEEFGQKDFDEMWAMVELMAPREVRVARALARDADSAAKKLSLDRIDSDVLSLYEVRTICPYAYFKFNTADPGYSPEKAFHRLVLSTLGEAP